MPDTELVRTGIAGLDDLLPGGIPRGNVILVEGAIGAGKTTMGVEFVYRGASQFDEPGIIVVFEVSPDKIMRDASGFGWDLRKLEQQGRLKIVFTTREVLRQELQQADGVLLEEAAKIGARRIFIDGVARLIGGPVPESLVPPSMCLPRDCNAKTSRRFWRSKPPRSMGTRVTRCPKNQLPIRSSGSAWKINSAPSAGPSRS